MSKPKLENWRIEFWRFSPCGESLFKLAGNIYNDSRFSDGTKVITSSIEFINMKENVAKTRNTVYDLGFCIDDTYVELLEEK